ncbi:hypothetical protein CKM354_001286400 [Cercospora kikuchii]|uniref:Uncharacterized protein n=1 Tax=Cercospora kikuchii TaxID=84275 RepID=A0A9P3FMZ9_9PEZI|nr:uncharacterized protein CKM354_001286400 [Cercospora kikuchii]GIZ49845.1 hypothetical protein CKM354_001286400 [Cercospora kikuchii]
MLHHHFRNIGVLPDVVDEYAEVKHQDAEGDTYDHLPAARYGKDKHWKNWLVKVALCALAVWGSVNIIWHLWDALRARPQDLSCTCGNSIAEAKKNHCRYDPLQLGWAPPHCRDDEVTDAFRHAAPAIFGHRWPYYERQDANSPMIEEHDVARFADTGQVYYTVHAHHLAHCMYIWMKQARVPQSGIVMPKRFGGDGHAEHCAGVAMINSTLDALVSVSSVSLDLDAHSEQSKKFHTLKTLHEDVDERGGHF